MFVFSKENAYGLVRTAAAYVYAWLIGLIPAVEEIVADTGMTEEFFVLLFGSVLYQIIRAAAEKLPWVGNLLVFNKKPDYQLDQAA